jgi:hypothetical protein
MSTAVAGRWTVHLGTAGVTEVQLACSPRRDDDPWLLSRALNDLLALGLQRADRPHAVGAGSGQPILHRQSLRFGGCEVELRAQHLRDGSDEVTLTLPSWDELISMIGDEDQLWEWCDAVAVACDAAYGVIGDGEPLQRVASEDVAGLTSLLRRHLGLLLPEHVAAALPRAACGTLRTLPASGLVVVVR